MSVLCGIGKSSGVPGLTAYPVCHPLRVRTPIAVRFVTPTCGRGSADPIRGMKKLIRGSRVLPGCSLQDSHSGRAAKVGSLSRFSHMCRRVRLLELEPIQSAKVPTISFNRFLNPLLICKICGRPIERGQNFLVPYGKYLANTVMRLLVRHFPRCPKQPHTRSTEQRKP